MGVHRFDFHINEINRLMHYMPGEGAKLTENNNFLEVLWFTIPPWYRAMVTNARFDHSQETFINVFCYFSCLQVIESMVNMAKGVDEGKQSNKNPNKPGVMKKLDTAKVTCGFCKKNRHAEIVYWKKKKAKKSSKKLTATAEVQVIEVLDDLDSEVSFATAESFDDLIGDLLIEVSADKLHLHIAQANNSKLSDIIAVSDLTIEVTVAK